MRKAILFAVLIGLAFAFPAAAGDGGEVAKHKFLVLDSPYAVIEDWTNLEYTRERFGLGRFEITIPIDHSMSSALVQYNRVLIVRGDDDWDNQAVRLWGVILQVRRFYAEGAGADVGRTGEGAAFVTAVGTTLTDYFLSNRAYPVPVPITLNPNGEGLYSAWTGDYTDVDEGVDSHDNDTTYLTSKLTGYIELVELEDYTDQGAVIAGIRIRSVWKAATDSMIIPRVLLLLDDHQTAMSTVGGNGSDTDWTGDYQNVDEYPSASWDDDTTYINSSTVGHQESYDIQSFGTPTNLMIPYFAFSYRARKTTADAVVIKPYVLISGTRYYLGTSTLTTSYVNYTHAWSYNPATGNRWQFSEIVNLEVGAEVVTCVGGEARITSIWQNIIYIFDYELDPIETTYAERYVDIVNNPATSQPWIEAELTNLQIGVWLSGNYEARVTAIEVVVYHKAVRTAGPPDDVLKAWVNANLGSGADADRLVTGFTEEADESAFPTEDETGGSFGTSYHGLSLADRQSFYRCQGVDLSSYSDWKLRLVDSAAKVATGWIKEADVVEALGDELVTNGGFPSATTGWTAGNSATLASFVGGQAGNCLKITENGDPGPYAYQDITVEAGKLYKFTVYVKQGTESTYDIRLRDEDNVAYLYQITGEATGSWVQYTCYFTAPSGCSTVRIFLIQTAPVGGTTLLYDTVVCKEVVHVGTDGIHIVQTKGGEYRGWETIESGFDYNDSTYTFDAYPAYDIAYNILLQRFLDLCKQNDIGMDIVGAWAAGATRLDAAASYEFQTSYPEGTDRTHSQSVNASVVISRGRGLVKMLDYMLDVVSAKSVAYALGEKDGLAQAIQEVTGDGPALAKEDGGVLLKEDSYALLLEHIPGHYRREAVLDVEGAGNTDILTDQGNKFLGDEGAEMEMVQYEHSAAAIHVPLADFVPGDLISFYDAVLSIGPLQPKVEMISCKVGGDGIERYEVRLGGVKRPALSEDAAFRATGKRRTLYVKQ